MGKFSWGIPAALLLLADVSSGTPTDRELKTAGWKKFVKSDLDVSATDPNGVDETESREGKSSKWTWKNFRRILLVVLIVVFGGIFIGVCLANRHKSVTPSCQNYIEQKKIPTATQLLTPTDTAETHMKTYVSHQREKFARHRMLSMLSLVASLLKMSAEPGGIDAKERERLETCAADSIKRDETEMIQQIELRFCQLLCAGKRPKWTPGMRDVPRWGESINDNSTARFRDELKKFYDNIDQQISKEDEASEKSRLEAVKLEAPSLIADRIRNGTGRKCEVPSKEVLLEKLKID